jgi:tetratricopeptide (TPR) repeat protein
MIPENSKSASVYNNIGITYFDLGQYQLALDNYNEAINIKPDYSYAYNNRAFVYLNTGNIESGCKDAKKACELGNCTALQAATGKGLCH